MILITEKPNVISKWAFNIMPFTGKKVKSPKETAVFDYVFHTGHNASFDDFKTLVKEYD